MQENLRFLQKINKKLSKLCKNTLKSCKNKIYEVLKYYNVKFCKKNEIFCTFFNEKLIFFAKSGIFLQKLQFF